MQLNDEFFILAESYRKREIYRFAYKSIKSTITLSLSCLASAGIPIGFHYPVCIYDVHYSSTDLPFNGKLIGDEIATGAWNDRVRLLPLEMHICTVFVLPFVPILLMCTSITLPLMSTGEMVMSTFNVCTEVGTQ